MEEISASNLAVWSLLAGAIGGAINSLVTGMISYRKTRDAGALELVKAEQANQSAKLEVLGKRHLDCEKRHAEAVDRLTQAIEKQAELRGELTALRHIVIKDTEATTNLRKEVGDLRLQLPMQRRPGEASGT